MRELKSKALRNCPNLYKKSMSESGFKSRAYDYTAHVLMSI